MHIPRSRSSLSTLLGAQADAPDAGRLVTIPIDSIVRNEAQPRTNFDPDALAALAESIAARGIIQPIAVRQLASDRFELIAGERRWLASQRAGLRAIPAIVHTADSRDSLVLALAENLVREDLNPLESARAYAALVDEFSVSVAELARAVGKSRPAVANTLRLLELPDDVLAYVETGALSEGHARTLLQLPDRASQRRFAKLASERSMSVRELETAVRTGQVPQATEPVKALHLADLQRRATRATRLLFDRPTKLRQRRNGVVVELKCADEAEALELVAKMERLAQSK
jgi:ParB family chromosome partitioning protein